jgi:hypothetical protein
VQPHDRGAQLGLLDLTVRRRGVALDLVGDLETSSSSHALATLRSAASYASMNGYTVTRVSFTTKAVARLRISTCSRSRRLSARESSRSWLVSPSGR